MNPLARGVHSSSKSSKAYRRMQNEFGEADECPQAGRLRLVGTRRKNKTTESNKGFNKKDGPSDSLPESVTLDPVDNFNESWTGEFPSEFSSGDVNTRNNRSRSSMDMDGSVITSGTSVVSRDQSADAAVAPTITKPFPQNSHSHTSNYPASRDFRNASAPAASAAHHSSAQKSVVSSATFDSHEQVEKPSITSPSLHQWSRHNRMGGARKMLSEKTINTIQSTATAGTKDTTGTLNTSGGHTATTADSTLRGSLASITGTSLQDLSGLMGDSPVDRNNSSYTQLTMEAAAQQQRDEMRSSSHSNHRESSSAQPNETEEDRMMRLAMEMSLRDFEDQQQSISTGRASPSRSAAFAQAQHQVQLRNRLNVCYRQNSCHSLFSTQTEEATEVLVENPHRLVSQRSRQSSSRLESHFDNVSRSSSMSNSREPPGGATPSVVRQIEQARNHLPPEEAAAIERALLDTQVSATRTAAAASAPPPVQSLSLTETEEIERAIREADAMESQQSVTVALQLQAEEAGRYNIGPSSSLVSQQSPIHRELETSPFHQMMHQDFDWNFQESNPAFGSAGQDLESNLEMMAFDFEADEDIEFLGNSAFNAFTRTLSRESNKSATKAELDARVQNQISKAVSNDLITKCNGVVKEGKEAAVYHADEGEGSNGHDVAIKVFRRLRSFRALSERFKDATPHEQLEIWAEKEYRNLIRASRARVPVASPIVQKENLVFMRFMGDDGWPSPQLKELELRKGSTEWTLLYSQIMVAVRRLYVTARLVHGDLSEENILVCPSQMVENKDDGAPSAPEGSDEMQAVLIDLAQAVDVAHPSSNEMLSKDIEKIRKFFNKKGIKTLCHKMAMEFVTAPDPAAEAAEQEQEDDEYKEALDAGAALAVAAVTQPVRAFSMNSCASSKSSHSKSTHSKSSHSSGLARHPDRAMSLASSSSKSSGGLSNSTGCSTRKGSQPDRTISLASTSTGTSSHSTGSSHKDKDKEKKKKDKKSKKESKKKKKDKSEKSQKRKSSSKGEKQSTTIDRELFPICADASTSNMFFEEDEENLDDSQWDAEWNEEIAFPSTTSP